MKPDRDRRPLVARIVFGIPILGWMLREAAEGDESALAWFAVSLVAVMALAAIQFGLPGLVIVMLGATALVLVTILIITRG